MLTPLLSRLGFSDKEQTLYSTLAEHGRMNATTLSKRTRIARATMYAVLDSLLARDIITKDQISTTQYYALTNPESLTRMIERERVEVDEKMRIAHELVAMVTPFLQSARYALPKIQLFEGRQDVEQMLSDYLPLWRESYAQHAENTLWGYQDPTFVESYLRWHEHMWKTRGAEERICLLSNAEVAQRERKRKVPNREVRAVPKDIKFSSSIWLYGEYIVLGMTRNDPHYVVQMKDALFAQNLRAIFQLLWRTTF